MESNLSVLLAVIMAILVNLVAYRLKFYRFPQVEKRQPIPVTIKHVVICFGIYLILNTGFFIRGILTSLKNAYGSQEIWMDILSATQVFLSILTIFCLIAYLKSQKQNLFKRLWKDDFTHSYYFDIVIGLAAWFISFPSVSVIGHVFDLLIQWIFGPLSYEQAAVRFVKMAMKSHFSTVMALISVLFLAPVIEELLFRGVLQTFFKRFLGAKWAIVLSACFFAFFHLSPSQGTGNISLAISLFFLGWYLGFLFERQSSLLASITLHATFNGISAIRILFFPEVT